MFSLGWSPPGMRNFPLPTALAVGNKGAMHTMALAKFFHQARINF